MVRNRLLLACAAILGIGTWIAWRSVLKVDAGSPPAPVAPSPAAVETPAVPEASLDRPAEETMGSRAGVTVDPKVAASVTAPRLLLSGTVVDDRGTPVEGADVLVTDNGPLTVVNGVIYQLKLRARSDSTGSFWIRDESQSSQLDAHASKTGYFNSDHASFEPGTTGMRLVVRRAGVLAGRVIVESGIPMELLHVHLAGPGPDRGSVAFGRDTFHSNRAPPEFEQESITPSMDGSFAFQSLLSKTARITISLVDEEPPVFDSGSLRVREIGEAPDPALDPVDLRGALRLLAFEVLDDSWKELSGATVVLSDPQGRVGDRFQVTQDGRARFLVRGGAYDVDVERTGWRRVHLGGIVVGQVVQLQRGLPVRIFLDGAESLPDAPYRLVVALLVDVKPPRSDVDGMGTFAEGRETAFLVSSPGHHDVAWYLESGTRQKRLSGTPRLSVDLRDISAEQAIHLHLPSDLREVWEAEVRSIESEQRSLEAQRSEPREQSFKRASGRPPASSTAEPRPR
jgi:hypothetical protein